MTDLGKSHDSEASFDASLDEEGVRIRELGVELFLNPGYHLTNIRLQCWTGLVQLSLMYNDQTLSQPLDSE